jgi:hypothetical protein
MGRRIWLYAAAITVGFVLAEYVPAGPSRLYAETFGPFLATSWLAYLMRRWWRENEARVLGLPTSGLAAIIAIAAFGAILGGFRLLWVDFWLFAPMLWPFLAMYKTLRKRLEGSLEAPAT